jgi:urea transporter
MLKHPVQKLFLQAYAGVFFLTSPWAGLVLAIVSFTHPALGVMGLLAVCLAYGVFRLIGQPHVFLNHPIYAVNVLLVGFTVGHLFQLQLSTLLVLIPASLLTVWVAVLLVNGFGNIWHVPVLSLPFVIVATLLYLVSSHAGNLYANDLYMSPLSINSSAWPPLLIGFLKSMGGLMFLPETWVGLVVIILLALHSVWFLGLAVIGFCVAVFLEGSITGSFESAMSNVAHFNSMLVAIMVGAVFNFPLLINVIWAVLAVSMATLIGYGLNWVLWPYHIPVFTLPFVVVSVLWVYGFNILAYRYRSGAYAIGAKSLVQHFASLERYSPTYITLSLPFLGSWTVWQGFNGDWTHQGLSQYAYDFVKTDEQGKTHRPESNHLLTDYYCFHQPVLSPVWGRVIKVIHLYPDNPIGSLDESNHWGNYVIIEDWRGFFVVIAHFAYNTIEVYEGSSVQPGTRLGLCGNSGYSPQPHIHIQVQLSPVVGGQTQPFRFLNYRAGTVYVEQGLPVLNSTIELSSPQPFAHQLTTFLLDEELVFECFEKEKQKKDWAVRVKIDAYGIHYFETHRGRLFFGKKEGSFYVYRVEGNDPYLKDLACAMASFPLTYFNKISWRDVFPDEFVPVGWRGIWLKVIGVIFPTRRLIDGWFQMENATEVRGYWVDRVFKRKLGTRLLLDPYQKITFFSCGDRTFKRKKK